jgi:hypothetical protein
MNIGVFAIDPGQSTGIAWGVIDPTQRLAADCMRLILHKGSATITGDPMQQARLIWSYWLGFKTQCVTVSLLSADHVHLVMEDFRLVPNATPGKDTTAPERVAWAFEGYRSGRNDTYRRHKHFSEVQWQEPAAAARYKTQEMLKPVDCWVRGRQHERSAFSHMYLYAAKLLDRTKL